MRGRLPCAAATLTFSALPEWIDTVYDEIAMSFPVGPPARRALFFERPVTTAP
jgi:hypothetical protein